MKSVMRILMLGFLLLTAACNNRHMPVSSALDSSPGGSAKPSPPVEIKVLFDRCVICHNGSGAPGNWSNYDEIVAKKDVLGRRIVEKAGPPMPPIGAGVVLSDSERAIIGEWLKEGAPSGQPVIVESFAPAVNMNNSVASMVLEQSAVAHEDDNSLTEDEKNMIERGRQQATTYCLACHTAKGSGQFPILNGQNKDYLILQLKAFKSGERVNGIMNGIVGGIDESDFAALAYYFSSASTQAQ